MDKGGFVCSKKILSLLVVILFLTSFVFSSGFMPQVGTIGSRTIIDLAIDTGERGGYFAVLENRGGGQDKCLRLYEADLNVITYIDEVCHGNISGTPGIFIDSDDEIIAYYSDGTLYVYSFSSGSMSLVNTQTGLDATFDALSYDSENNYLFASNNPRTIDSYGKYVVARTTDTLYAYDFNGTGINELDSIVPVTGLNLYEFVSESFNLLDVNTTVPTDNAIAISKDMIAIMKNSPRVLTFFDYSSGSLEYIQTFDNFTAITVYPRGYGDYIHYSNMRFKNNPFENDVNSAGYNYEEAYSGAYYFPVYDTSSNPVYYAYPFFADFTYENDSAESKIIFTDASIILDSSITSYEWYVDGTIEDTTSSFEYLVSQNQDLNVCLSISDDSNNNSFYCEDVIALDSIYPTIDANILFLEGFGADQDLNYNMTCYDNGSPIDYLIQWLDTNGSTVSIYNSSDANATLVSGTYTFGNNNGRVQFTCTDLGGNPTSYLSSYVYGVNVYFVNEKDGSLITTSDIDDLNTCKVESLDGSYFYDFKSEATTGVGFTSNDDVLVFEFQYKDALDTVVRREIDFSLIDDANIPVCLAPFEQFYLNRFTSSQDNKPVIVYNEQSGCYNLVSTTHYIFETLSGVDAVTISKPYKLSTVVNGTEVILSYIDGASSLQHNLDALVFSQEQYTVTIGEDSVGFSCLINNVTDECDLNTLIIGFKAFDSNNQSTTLKIYLDSTLLYNYTEFSSPDDFTINWYYGDETEVTDENVLKLVVTIVDEDGESRTFNAYFDITGEQHANVIPSLIAFVFGVIVILFGLTLVKSQEALGWFGLIICIIGLGITTFAVQIWWIQLLQGAIISIIIYLMFITKGTVRPGEIV